MVGTAQQHAANRITQLLESHQTKYLSELRELCALECPTSEKAGVDEAMGWVRRWAEQQGWQYRVWNDPLVGNSIVTQISGTGHLRILLAAHNDTVYPVGVAASRPLREEDGKLLGPGVCDNKSGLLSGLYAMKALQQLDLLGSIGTISLFAGSDEETDMRLSLDILRELAPEHDIALVLEAGRENGDIVAARKGGGLFQLATHGRAAHAGVEPEKGAHAILDIAHKIIALQALNGIRPGVTVNVGVISGGSVPNAVPDSASVAIDARVVQPEDVAVVTAAIQAIAEQQHVRDVTATLNGGFRVGPMAKTPQIASLAALAGGCAEELGFQIAAASTGGISYANLLAELGLPVLDGLGPVGGLDHSPQEYIDPASIVPRTALLALVMLRAGER